MGNRQFEEQERGVKGDGTAHGAESDSAFHRQLFGDSVAYRAASLSEMPPMQQLSPVQLALLTYTLPGNDTSIVLQNLPQNELNQFNRDLSAIQNPTTDQKIQALSHLPQPDLINALSSVPQQDVQAAWNQIESKYGGNTTTGSASPSGDGPLPPSPPHSGPGLQAGNWAPWAIGIGGATTALVGAWMFRNKIPGLNKIPSLLNLKNAAKIIEDDPLK